MENTSEDDMIDPQKMSSKKVLLHKPIFHIMLIIILGLLAYSNTFHVPFLFDDTEYVVDNPAIKDFRYFKAPFNVEAVKFPVPLFRNRYIGFLTFALNYKIHGLDVAGYHIFNLSVHILNALLVYWFVVLTFKTQFLMNSKLQTHEHLIALFSGLLFVVHPIQTQAVTYISQRFTSLATFFYLLSLVMYIKSRLQQSVGIDQLLTVGSREFRIFTVSAKRYMLYAASLLSAVLAMLTKEIAFTLPVVTALYELMFFEGRAKKRVLFLIPLLLTMLIVPLNRISTDSAGNINIATKELTDMSRWDYLFTQFRVIVTYIRLLLLPINQNVDYDYPLYHSFLEPNVFLSFLFLLSIFCLGVYLFYISRITQGMLRLAAFGISWFFITLSVESSFIPILDLIFEHRVYLPSVGVMIASSTTSFYVLRFVFHYLNSKYSKPKFISQFFLTTAYFLLATVIITLSIATYRRNTVWQNETGLWEDVVRKSPNKARGYNELGIYYWERGWTDKAISNFQIAIKLNPYFIAAHNNLSIAYSAIGQPDKATEHHLITSRLKQAIGNAHGNQGSSNKQ